MKLQSFINRLSPKTPACAILSLFLLSPAAPGAITVHFVEEGADVRVSFSGTLDLSSAPGTGTTIFNTGSTSGIGSGFITIGGGGFSEASAGTPTTVPFPTVVETQGLIISDPAFGYTGDVLVYAARHISGGVVGNVTSLTADPALDTFTLVGQDLASLSAELGDIAEGATLWTASGNAADRFIFSREIPPVPEPSSALLMSFGLVFLLRRRL